MFKLRESKIELTVLGIMYLMMLAFCYISGFGCQISFIDTDDFMRVLRTQEFFSHFDLNNTIISRGNYPIGCDLHWTRLYDFFLIGLTYIIDFFVDSVETSVKYACFLISPITGLISMVFVHKILQNFLKKDSIFLATAIFCASPFLIPFFSFGRPDHHSFIMMSLLVYLHYFIQVVKNETDNKNLYIKFAIMTTLCVWASPETLIVLLMSDAVLLVSFFNDYKKLENLYFKNLLTACFIGIIAFIPLPEPPSAHALSVCILLLLVPYTTINQKYVQKDVFFKYWHFVCLFALIILFPKIQPVEYDKISIVHVALYLCSATFFAINMQLVGKKEHLYDSLTWAVVIGIVFLSLYPLFIHGMEGDMPSFVKKIWLSKIAEMESPMASDNCMFFVVYAIITASAIAVKIQEIYKKDITTENILWATFIILAITYLLFATLAYRMIPYSFLFGLPLVVSLGMSSKYVKHLHKIYRMLLTMFLTILFLFVTCFFSDTTCDLDCKKKNYSDQELFQVVDNLSFDPVVIMAHSNDGPKLLYYTKHRVQGAPYHRQVDGIINSYVVMEMDFDEELVKKVLVQTNSKYIFIRKNKQTEQSKSFVGKILRNEFPKWITIEKIPEKFSDIVIARVDQDLLNKEE